MDGVRNLGRRRPGARSRPRPGSVGSWSARALAVAVVAGSAVGFAVGPASAANIPITVTPSTGLSNGQTVTITGSGFTPSSIGNILECNTDAGQPTVHDGAPVNSDIAVSCNAPSFSHLVTVSSSGTVSGTFPVVQGTVGPPCGPSPAVVTCPATDSTGGDPAADAAKYPCPPTAAQQAAGDTCTLTYGDQANDAGVATILFGAEAPPGATTTTPAPVTTTTHAATTVTTQVPTTAAPTATTAAPVTSPGTSLASTGAGPHLWIVALVGVIALYLGSVGLALVERPRLLRRLLGRARPAGQPARGTLGQGAAGLWFDGWEPDSSP